MQTLLYTFSFQTGIDIIYVSSKVSKTDLESVYVAYTQCIKFWTLRGGNNEENILLKTNSKLMINDIL